MCVIAIVNEKRPTPGDLAGMWEANPSGAGIAWREGGKVHWAKGLKLDEITAMVAEKPLPLVVHFRIPSCGGTSPGLTHPFPVERSASLQLRGVIDGEVLFHNGHWNAFNDVGMRFAASARLRVPRGPWSDSRTMAYIAAFLGPSFIDWIDQKVVIFGTETIEVFQSSGWTKYDGFLTSNTYWYSRVPRGNSSHSTFRAEDYRRNRSEVVDSASRPYHTTAPASMAGGDQEPPSVGARPVVEVKVKLTPGGADQKIPFAQALTLYREEKLSANQWRKAKRQYQQAMNKLIRVKHAMESAPQGLPS